MNLVCERSAVNTQADTGVPLGASEDPKTTVHTSSTGTINRHKMVPLAPMSDFEKNTHPSSPSGTISPDKAVKELNLQVQDGGTAAWLTVFGAWCAGFCSFGWLNSIGVFQEYYQTTLLPHYSASEISWIPSLQIFFMFAMGPIVGKIYDSYGPRYLMIIGTFLHVFGLMMTSISTKYYQVMLSQGVCSAIGVSCIFQPSLSCVGGWFDKKRGMAFGIMATGSSIGGVIFPIMVTRLIREINFAWAMRISSFLILGLLALASLTIKQRLPPNPRPMTIAEFMAPFKEIPSLGLTIGAFLLTFAIFTPITYIIVEAGVNGMSPDLAQYLLAMLNAASLFGRLFSGALADIIGQFNVFIFVCYTSGILMLALWIPTSSNTGTIIFTILFGFFSGAYVSLLPALIAQLSPPKEVGTRQGAVFLFASLGGLTTGPIAGAILRHDKGSFLGVKLYAGVLCIAGTSVLLATRIHATGWKLFAKY